MAQNVEVTVTSELINCKFALQLDESTFGSSNILMAYVRYYSPSKQEIIDEFFFAKHLKADAKGESIFTCVKEYLEKWGIPITNIVAVASDGAPAMVGRYRGFLALLREYTPNVRVVHCVLHRQHLVAKNLSDELHEAMKVCIKAINKIKASPLRSRMFASLCDENDESHNRLLFHTDVRWLSKGDSLQRLVDLFDVTVKFFKDVEPSLSTELQRCKNHVNYLADLYTRFNEVSKKLQGKNVTIIQARTVLLGFRKKLCLYKSSLGRQNFQHFPNLLTVASESEGTISDDDIFIYVAHLEKLEKDFEVRFRDLQVMEVPNWIVSPFEVNPEHATEDPAIQEELIEMRLDLEAQALFNIKGSSEYWSSTMTAAKYPKMAAEAGPLLLGFPSSYLVEAGFSHVNALLTKQRNHMDIEERGDLRLKLTSFQPDIGALVNSHQSHPSH